MLIKMEEDEKLLKVWANHFRVLAESSLSDGQGNSDEWVEKIKRLEALSYENEEYLLDVPFTSDEVARAVSLHCCTCVLCSVQLLMLT